MQLHEKIRFFRHSKGFTQEQMAEKLNITPVAYSNIERGESNVSMKRLEEIASIMKVELLDLLSLGEKNVIVLHGDANNSLYCFLQNVNFSEKQDILPFELQKASLMLKQQEKQITLLEQEIQHLKEIINLLKEQKSM